MMEREKPFECEPIPDLEELFAGFANLALLKGVYEDVPATNMEDNVEFVIEPVPSVTGLMSPEKISFMPPYILGGEPAGDYVSLQYGADDDGVERYISIYRRGDVVVGDVEYMTSHQATQVDPKRQAYLATLSEEEFFNLPEVQFRYMEDISLTPNDLWEMQELLRLLQKHYDA